MFKSTEVGADDAQSVWYVQDGKGGVWRVDLAHSHTVKPPQRLLSFHAGKINALDVCPVAHFAATTGDDGSVRVHDYIKRTTLATAKGEPEGCGTCLSWVPKRVSDVLYLACITSLSMIREMRIFLLTTALQCVFARLTHPSG